MVRWLPWLAMIVAVIGMSPAGARPLLDPTTPLPRMLAPYDLVKLNYLGMNYCENLLDGRLNITSYSHLNYDTAHQDAWHLQFPDDSARLLESVAWEAEFSPVARVELARRLTKGLLAAHYPGTRAAYAFRHRSGGKTYLMLDDEAGEKAGRLTLSTWGDALQGGLKVGFRAQRGGEWLEIDRFTRTDDPRAAGSPGTARSPRCWHQSPFVFRRHYASPGLAVDFTGRYWLSDEDKPLEYAFRSPDTDALQIVIGEPGKPMPLLADAQAPGIIHLPDRRTSFSSAAGGQVFERPAFHYLILRKHASWATWSYSSALLVMWEGQPARIEARPENGFGELRFTFPRQGRSAAGRLWLYPFPFVDDTDMGYLYRNAEHFLRHGTLLLGGYPSQQLLNAIPAGLAAGAYMLARYHDPAALTAAVHAENAVDQLFEGEAGPRRLMRAFFPVKAAAWMIKLARMRGDGRLVAKYTPLLDAAVGRLCSPQLGYDGKGWPGGWEHFNSTKALWLAYDATGHPEYRAAWQRALTVYTIDPRGIYRYGRPLAAPGGFDTYSGALPLGVWGNAGMLTQVEQLINLAVPNNWHGEQTVKDTWNDTGAGPWAQDDANPEYLGISLKGAAIPRTRQYVIPVGAFPVYYADGRVTITRRSLVRNPFFRPGNDAVRVVDGNCPPADHRLSTVVLIPGTAGERAHLAQSAGVVKGGRRLCTGTERSLVYRFDTHWAAGAAVDLRLQGAGYRVEVSPDGRRWYERLDTWSDDLRTQSIDLSCFTGNRDELVRLQTISPPADRRYLVGQTGSKVREGRRAVPAGSSVTWRLEVPGLVECRLEVLVGNGYRLECSGDGKAWRQVLSAAQVPARTGLPLEDAGWLHLLDATPYLKGGEVYLRLTDLGTPSRYGGQAAWLQRLAVYGIFDSPQLHVRLSNVDEGPQSRFALDRVTFRRWVD